MNDPLPLAHPPAGNVPIPAKSPKLRKYLNQKIQVERNGVREVGILRAVYPVKMPYGPERTWATVEGISTPSFPIFRTQFYEVAENPSGGRRRRKSTRKVRQ
jgi:hypothetical protein